MEKTKTESQDAVDIAYPSRYKVVIFNDDSTPIDYVIQLLIEVFNKDLDGAKDITIRIHEKGKGVAGIYSYEVAEQKVSECELLNRYHGHALQIELEELK
jgi:ATP-dependent Clp protease adaptor protein ClpS